MVSSSLQPLYIKLVESKVMRSSVSRKPKKVKERSQGIVICLAGAFSIVLTDCIRCCIAEIELSDF